MSNMRTCIVDRHSLHTDARDAQPGVFWYAIIDNIMRRISVGKAAHAKAIMRLRVFIMRCVVEKQQAKDKELGGKSGRGMLFIP